MSASSDLELSTGDPAPLVAVGAATFSRGEVRAQADALLETLRARAIERVLVCSDNPLHLLRSLDACARAGIDLWIAHTNLQSETVDELCTSFGVQLRVGDEDVLLDGPATGRPAPAGRVHMMTSGTTGRPKVAAHTLAALLARARAGAGVPANRDGRWLLTYQPTGFAGIQVLLTATCARGLIVAPSDRTPAGFFAAAQRWGVTQISATPTFWRSFLMVVTPGAIALRQITLGGEAADQATLDRLKKAFPTARITHIYASTEAGVVFAVHDGLEGFPRAWLDRPNQGVELRIVDDLLHIKTPNAMRGYVTDNAQPLLDDGWLKTADRCEIIGERVRVLGRQDSTINVGGSKVYPLAVETFMLGLPGVQEAKVYGVQNPITGFIVGADVVLAEGVDPAAARKAILAACREKLAGYQVPRVFNIVDAIRVGASGKKG
jgi:acyl-coenzyme A synthetase/AMP-(fatty) acid ligase